MRKTSQNHDATDLHEDKRTIPAAFKLGIITFTFLVIGYQTALFVHSAGITTLLAHRDSPDTVYVVDETLLQSLHDNVINTSQVTDKGIGTATAKINSSARIQGKNKQLEKHGSTVMIRKPAEHVPQTDKIWAKHTKKKAESFNFDPNTVSTIDLQRLGFSEKQAQSIAAYREKGGRFRTASDFAKSYVVSDSIYKRLEPYISIPKIDINVADSASFDTLPGIGGYFASKMVEYREKLHGYSYPEQLMDIYNFDEEKYEKLKDLITVGPAEGYPLWTADEETLSKHPYIRNKAIARSIVLFRNNHEPDEFSIKGLERAGILKADDARKLERCRIATP